VTLEAEVNVTGVEGRALNVEDQLDAAYVRAESSVPELVPTTATQSSASGHERLLSLVTEATESTDQEAPPFVVVAKAPVVSATTQSSESAHDIDEGAKLTVPFRGLGRD
jgi:hypothetical protein